MKPKVYANMLVADEENYIKYTMSSVSDCVDKFIVIDTGSTDDTLSIVKSNFKGEKLHLWETRNKPEDAWNLTLYRNAMLDFTIKDGADWMLILDGHEVYYKKDIEYIVGEILPSNQYDLVAVGYHHINGPNNVCGINSYQRGWPFSPPDCAGWRILRFINVKAIPGLHWNWYREWPRETLVDETKQEIVTRYRMWVAKDIRFVHFAYGRSRNDKMYAWRPQVPPPEKTPFTFEYPEVMKDA